MSYAKYHSKRNFVERVHSAENDLLMGKKYLKMHEQHKYEPLILYDVPLPGQMCITI